MRVLVIGKFCSEAFGLHISETLESMGHQVTRFEIGHRVGPATKVFGRFGEKAGRTIYDATDQAPVIRSIHMRRLWDLLESAGSPEIAIVSHDFLWPREVERIKKTYHAQVVVWFPDAVSRIGQGYLLNAPYDALFFKDPFIVNRLRGVLSVPVYYLPECHNPVRHVLPPLLTDEELRPYRCDVTTAGGMHSYRVAFFSRLGGYDVRLWGTPPPFWLNGGAAIGLYQGRSVWDQEKAKAFRAAKIVVNNLHYAEVWGLNAKAFEVAAAGAFQMIDWRPGLNQLFEDGKEVVSFRGIDDLRCKIDYYLTHGEERATIANAGMQRALRDHTYQLRLTLLLDTLAGNGKGYPMPHIDEK